MACLQRLALNAVPALVPPLLRAFYSHCAFTVLNRRVYDEYVLARRPFVGVVWHEDFLTFMNFFRGLGLVIMVSRSRDGELVARALHRMGYRTVRGSSSAGGREALVEFTDLVRSGHGAAIIADGPRGPAQRAKIGCVIAARNSGAPILTVGCHASSGLRARNWDRTLIPSPFARVVLAFGDPLHVPPGASVAECERFRQEVDARMEALEERCRSTLADEPRTMARPAASPRAWAVPRA